MKIEPVNLDKNIDLCLAFRRDAHIISYGSDKKFDANECSAWFESLQKDPLSGFQHVILDNHIVGQIEFRSHFQENNNAGYINLLYLLPTYRRKGIGKKIQNYVFSTFLANGCFSAYLRYLPRNVSAEKFYINTGWTPVGLPNQRGQLMTQEISHVASLNYTSSE
jgi:GNAT superfamily N-acetyltransferase